MIKQRLTLGCVRKSGFPAILSVKKTMKRIDLLGVAVAFSCIFLSGNFSITQSQVIKLGDLIPVWYPSQITTIVSQTPAGFSPGYHQSTHPGPFYFDAPIATLRNQSNSSLIDFHASNWLGSDVFSSSLPYYPFADEYGYLITSPTRVSDWYPWNVWNQQNPSLSSFWQNRLLLTTELPDASGSWRGRSVHDLRSRDSDVSTWLDDETWIPNFYKITPPDVANNHNLVAGDLLGFVHVESMDHSGVRKVYAIGLAYSDFNNGAGGTIWRYCGDIIRTGCNIANGANNITGVSYVVNNGSFYVYFNDYSVADQGWYTSTGKDINTDSKWAGKRACVAAAPIATVLAQAWTNWSSKNTSIIPFYKYLDNGTWDTDNAVHSTNAGKDLLPMGIRPLPMADLHSDAAFCKPLNRYLLTVSNGTENHRTETWDPNDPNEGAGQLWLYSSRDGLNWDRKIMIDSTPGFPYIEKPHSFFVSTNPESDDCHIVGNHFYIFIPHSPRGQYCQELWRREITIIPDQIKTVDQMMD